MIIYQTNCSVEQNWFRGKMTEIINECRDLMEDWCDVGNIDSCDQISEEEMQPPCASKDYTTSLTESTRKWIWV